LRNWVPYSLRVSRKSPALSSPAWKPTVTMFSASCASFGEAGAHELPDRAGDAAEVLVEGLADLDDVAGDALQAAGGGLAHPVDVAHDGLDRGVDLFHRVAVVARVQLPGDPAQARALLGAQAELRGQLGVEVLRVQ
jgi:hypothetical protein